MSQRQACSSGCTERAPCPPALTPASTSAGSEKIQACLWPVVLWVSCCGQGVITACQVQLSSFKPWEPADGWISFSTHAQGGSTGLAQQGSARGQGPDGPWYVLRHAALGPSLLLVPYCRSCCLPPSQDRAVTCSSRGLVKCTADLSGRRQEGQRSALSGSESLFLCARRMLENDALSG